MYFDTIYKKRKERKRKTRGYKSSLGISEWKIETPQQKVQLASKNQADSSRNEKLSSH